MLKRIYSIDIFRAITMVLMIWVNDFWSLTDIPQWLHHAKGNEDFLGFSDIIFPCFLFIVGMSVPYAIRKRIKEGENYAFILFHIVLRSLALLVMGFFTVNIDNLNSEASGISRQFYQIAMVAAFFLIWNVYPKSTERKMYLFYAMQTAGIAILLMLAYLFKGGEDGTQNMTVQWWGILGLIGWTYFFTATIYLFAHKSSVLLMAFWGLFTFINIAEHAGWFNLSYLPGGGALQGLAFAGVAASLLLDYVSKIEKRKQLPLYYLGIGLVLLAIGLALRNFFIISKIQSTPTWVFLCNGIAFGFLALVYFVVDVKGKLHWFKLIKPAGTNTLTAYLIPYVWYSVAAYAFTLPMFMKTGALGLIKSLVFALIIVGITAVLDQFKIKLKI